ncbi:hypothetical protein SAMN04488038_11572 [Solimonas aquatica]|uniref:Ig-like domain-containing protein n=1 Tax=Solimonas aquatica TaxID=489703 RepID=A0A1H9L939_9GAMM|nr:hypothetical protein [Solimonas aquatica]SER07914.1 hypothetical protein SAMN04488038_11572 [Solimonas aquatica]
MIRFRPSHGAVFVGAVGLLLLTACQKGGPVGEGQGPKSVRVQYGGDASVNSLRTVECATFGLNAIATFDGDRGKTDSAVTSRVTWSSSNPGVIDVSNGDIPVAPGSSSYYPAGTVIARTVGSAVIRADYAGLSNGFSVSALPISSARIAPALTRMAPDSNTTFKLYVQAQTDQLEQDLTSSAVWSLPGSSPAAQVSSGSTVKAATEPLDSAFTLEAKLYTCDRDVTQTMSLGEVDHLQLSYEQPTSTSDVPLLIGDLIRVDAVFKDSSAPLQNLSGQVETDAQALGYNPGIATISTTSTTTVTVGGVTRLEPNQYLLVTGNSSALDSPIAFQVRYDKTVLDLKAATRVFTFQNIDLVDMRVDASTATLQFPALGKLNAYATFKGEGFERPISRYVNWTVADATLLAVSNGLDGGLLTPANLAGDTTVYTKVNSTAAAIPEQTTRVTVKSQQ